MSAYTFISLTLFPVSQQSLESVMFYIGERRVKKVITGCSDCLKTFGRKAGSSIAFHVLKELSHSNDCFEAMWWFPPKGGLWCGPDAVAAPPSLVLLKIPLWLFWWAWPWQSARLQTSAPPFECFPLSKEIRDADEGKHWCLHRRYSVSLSTNSCNITYCQGYNELLLQ